METFFPDIHNNRNSALVFTHPQRCQNRRHGSPIRRKTPLSLEDLKVAFR